MIEGKNKVTIPHEVGHTAGLYHPDVDEQNNEFLGVDNADKINRIKGKTGQRFSPAEIKANPNNLMYSNAGYQDSQVIDLSKPAKLNRRQFDVIVNRLLKKLNKK